MDYFKVFGLPRQLGIDTLALEKKFYELSRKYHPDYFTTASPSEKTQAVRMTALLNDAYRTLRHPVHRVEYLLSLYGFKPDSSNVPQALSRLWKMAHRVCFQDEMAACSCRR